MMGVTLTMMKVDEELKELIDYPSDSMGLTHGLRVKMQALNNKNGKTIVISMIKTIQANKEYLSRLMALLAMVTMGLI